MANTSYVTSVSVCEDTTQNFELFDLLKQADPAYSAVDPAKIKLYVYDGAKWVLSSSGFFSAVDLDTLTVDAAAIPNFNGVKLVRVLGYDSTGNTFTLDVTVNVTPVNDAPSGADETVNVANGDTYVIGLGDFGFTDPIDGNNFKSVVVSALPTSGTLLLNGTAVTAGQEILAADIAAGKLTYVAPTTSGGDFGFSFQVRDDGGIDPDCGGVDLDPTPNTITFHVPSLGVATLGDKVWLDTNGNGVQDAGEAGIAGVTVVLKDASGNPIGSTTTDSNGNYSFTVTPGTYSVAVQAPTGYVFTGQHAGGTDATDSDVNSTGQSGNVTLLSGQSNPNVDAGLYKLAELGDKVWYDTNGNGVQDSGEAGVAGVRVVLLDAAGNAVTSTTTDASGNYLFSGLKPGTYSVQFDKTTLPSGYSFTTQDAASGTDATDSDANPTTGQTIQTVLDSGESDRTWDAGIIANPGAITGTVLEDLDHNGTGDTPIAGVTVTLVNPTTGAVIATTTTDTSGNYSFTGVPPGNYAVVETNKPGYTDVSDKDGGDLNSIAVTVTPGVTNTGNNFVDERLPGSISGTVREDLDNNNTGDTPISGVTVTLINATTGAVVATTTTDTSGNYSFTGVPAGSYQVVETNKPGYTDVGDIDGGDPNRITVNLTAGQSSTGNDFVDERPATLGDKVWLDTNGNGVQDAGEAGIAGVTVVLKDASGNPIGSTTTDSNGNYSFTVTPGTYSVAVQAPTGYVFTGQHAGGTDATDSDVNSTGQSGNVTLLSGQSNPNVDAGLYKLAELGDKVWYDTNGNGVQDSGEAGVAGVRVVLLDAAGNAVTSTTTDASGNYLFSGLKPGTYSVQFDKTTLPSGYSFTTQDAASGTDATDSDANPTTGQTIQTVLDSGESDRTWDAGIIAKAGSISGTVREDLDNNNTGDTPIAGVTVTLINATTGAIVATTTTDVNGNYTFNSVPAGSYKVVETNKAGYLDVSDVDGGDPNSIAVTLTPGQNSTGNDFVDERSAAIGDRVWLDSNANGVQDAGEAGVSGVTVKLLDSTGNVVSTTTTDASGNYLFSSLAPGDYAIQVVAPSGYVVTSKDQGGNDATDSDVDPTTGKSINTTLSAGETDLTWDAGLYKTASIGDKVWLDANKNGVQDSGETGVSGVTVKLLDSLGNVVATATTDANGNYLFSNLKPGSYAVQVVAPTGYTFTTQDSAAATDATDSDVDQTTGKTALVTVASGESNLTVDAGLVAPTASYGDRVWLDKNANGVQDAGETGISGVTVKLLNSAGTVVATTTTDANGNYLFTNLTPGDYSAQVVAPTGYFISPKDQGGNDATDSDFDPTTGKTITTTLSANENDLTWDAGLYQKASIGDKVWADCNNNGLQDTGEAGVPGVTVKLLDASGNVVATTLTDANGNYVFKDLMPGTYSVQFVAPAGYTFTTKDVGTNDAIDSDVGASTVLGTTNLIVNGSFENGTYGWCGDGDSIEVNKATSYGVSGATGTYVAELDANCTGTVTGFYQDITTVAGQTYQLSLDVAQRAGYAAGTNTVEVFWEGVKIATIDPASTTLTTYTFNVTAADSSSRLEFKEQSGDDDSIGGIIDNVSLVTVNGGGTVGTTIQTTLESGENDMTWDAGLTVVPVTACFDFSGSSATDGTDGNIRCYTDNGISVNASAWSRDRSSGSWAKAWLGTYGGGLGVTDSSEGSATDNSHTVDNVGGRDNYVLFEFSQSVVVDKTYLGYVVGDSDMQIWIGTVDGAFDSHITLSDAVLASMGFTEVNQTTLTSTRWADLNAAGYVGNVLIIAADTTDTSPEDYFKIDQLVVSTASAFCATDVSIGDKVWDDANMNGVQDSGEAGIAGVTVKLLNSAGQVIETTTTDANGSYLFSQLAAGDYKIQVVTPTGYTITTQNAGSNDAVDSDIDSTGTTALYTLTQGSNNLTVDAGFYKPSAATGKIGDRVWEDKNHNGIQDSGESGIKGVTVKLLNSAGTVVATTTTDASGNYLFDNLAAGTYKVQVVAPTGYYMTLQDAAGYNGTDSAFNSSGYTGAITLGSGESVLKADAGLYRKASVGDRVWLDSNNNGIQDSGECGVVNVTVKLLNSAGTVVATTCTDSSGNYKFTDLDPGQYSLQFDKSSGYYYTGGYTWWGVAITQGVSSSSYQWTTKDAYSNNYDAVDSDVSRVSSTYYNQGYTSSFTLVSGQYDSTRDGGICPIVIDLDGDGIHTIARENATGTFDLLGTGTAIHSGWLSSGDAFLAVDTNGNGKIDSISELFGGNGAGQGFAKLASFDSNGDGVVDAKDAHFGDLLVWRDANGNGQTDAGELMSLTDAGVASLKVSYFALPAVDEQGNLHLERSAATMADGKSVDMTDVYFNVDVAEAQAAGATLPTIADLLSTDVSLDQVLGTVAVAGDIASGATAVTVSDSAVAALGQLSQLYQEQQHVLAAA